VRLWRFLIAVACWGLGLLSFVLVMAPVHWLFGDVGGRTAAVCGALGVVLFSVLVAMSRWWHRQRTAERERRGFSVEPKRE
jgi:hypothetical protein